MKRKEESETQTLSRFLDRHFNPSTEQIEAAGKRVLQRLHEENARMSDCAALEPDSIRPAAPSARDRAVVIAGIAVSLAVALVAIFVWRTGRIDIVATASDGRTIRAGQLLRANDTEGAVWMLADGSRVELRAGSEAVFERADDGMRVRLNAGSIIVNATKQPAGRHLSVSTRDVLVSVIGTVFLVKADDLGSHVAVIQGEVRIKQGTVEKSLHPGDQSSSSSKAETLALEREIGWSREAAAYLTMLHQEMAQSLAAQQVAPRATTAPETPQFEAASIKPCPKDFQAPEGMRGGGSNSMRLSPGHLDALCMTVATLIRTAYRPLNNNEVMPGLREPNLRMNLTAGLGIEDGTRVRGGPDWVRSDKYTVTAVAEGATDAHTLQNALLMALLESRFHLKTHIEVEQIPVLALTIAKGGLKMKRATSESCIQPAERTGGHYDPVEVRRKYEAIRHGATPECGLGVSLIGPNVVHIAGNVPFSRLVDSLSFASYDAIRDVTNGSLIINKTGIPDTDTFNFLLEYAADEGAKVRVGLSPDLDSDVPAGPDIFDAIEKQLGLKLERTRGSREFVVIDHIERPTPN